MSRRSRLIAGVVLVLTMTLSLAERVWAATCTSSSTGAEAATAMVMSELMPGMEMAGTDQPQHDYPPGHSHDSDPQGNSGSCPFAPAGVTQGCAALALLPATNTGVRVTTLEATSVLVMVVSTPRSFHEASIFHPPRA